MPQATHHDAGVRLRRILVRSRLQSDDAVALLGDVVGADVGRVSSPADRHTRLRRVAVRARLQSDYSLALLRHVLHLQCGKIQAKLNGVYSSVHCD